MSEQQKQTTAFFPVGKADVVLDTDAYNEIDDQFAIAYLLRSKEKCNVRAICAAPFFNENSEGPKDGMEKSYAEIFKLLDLMGEQVCVYKGSEQYLPSEQTPVLSEAAEKMAEMANEYTPEHPLYIVAIGAITNVASALLLNPAVARNTVVVWLGGHAHHYDHTREFNMVQDVAAARVVMQSGVPFVQLPCCGVVDRFSISKPELEFWLCGKNKLADYLATNTIEAAERYAKGKAWSRVIWDVTAVAWLLNDENRFMKAEMRPMRLPTYDGVYEKESLAHEMVYVYYIRRDALMNDMLQKILA